MTVSRITARTAASLLVAATGLSWACSESPTTAVTVAKVEVSSPLGALLDVGSSTALSATAEDPSGHALPGAALAWSSSDPTVAAIDDVGFLRALTSGEATITVGADGVSGRLTVRVVEADRAAITAFATDAFLVSLLGAATADVESRLQSATAGCTDGATTGNLEEVQECVAAIEQEAAAASDATDRALLAALVLFFDEIERRIGA